MQTVQLILCLLFFFFIVSSFPSKSLNNHGYLTNLPFHFADLKYEYIDILFKHQLFQY